MSDLGWGSGGPLPVAPRPVATVAILGWLSPALPQVRPHVLAWVPLGHQSQPVIGTDHRRERHGGDGSGGNRELPRACLSSLLGRVLEASVNVATRRETGRGRAEEEVATRTSSLASSAAAGSGETRGRLSQLTHHPRAPLPPGQASSAPPAFTCRVRHPLPGQPQTACGRHQDEAASPQLALPSAPSPAL